MAHALFSALLPTRILSSHPPERISDLNRLLTLYCSLSPYDRRTSRGDLRMGKVSKFGVFSPAVIGAKVALGENRLNKIRGKVRDTMPITSTEEHRNAVPIQI